MDVGVTLSDPVEVACRLAAAALVVGDVVGDVVDDVVEDVGDDFEF